MTPRAKYAPGSGLAAVVAATDRLLLMVAGIVLGAWWLHLQFPGVLSVSLMWTVTAVMSGSVAFFVIESFLCRHHLARIPVPGKS